MVTDTHTGILAETREKLANAESAYLDMLMRAKTQDEIDRLLQQYGQEVDRIHGRPETIEFHVFLN